MPAVDTSKWTPVEHVSEQFLKWAQNPTEVLQGALYSIQTKENHSVFVMVDYL